MHTSHGSLYLPDLNETWIKNMMASKSRMHGLSLPLFEVRAIFTSNSAKLGSTGGVQAWPNSGAVVVAASNVRPQWFQILDLKSPMFRSLDFICGDEDISTLICSKHHHSWCLIKWNLLPPKISKNTYCRYLAVARERHWSGGVSWAWWTQSDGGATGT